MEQEELRVNFRWGKSQLDLLKHVAQTMGISYQTYIKQALFKQCLNDLVNAPLTFEHVKAPLSFDQLSKPERERVVSQLLERGQVLYSIGKFELAVAVYSQCLKVDPHCRNAYYQRAKAYRHLNNHKEGLKDCNALIESFPDFGGGYHVRAHHYEAMGKYDKAFADYKRTAEFDSRWAYLALIQSASLHLHLGNTAQALANANEAITLDASDPDGYCFRANLYEKLGDQTSADADKAAALKLCSTSTS
ncbi:MAG: tetratricopeptide repeat protein [Candidatus Melainabacteria bacterium]|nr:MAG: tetratricopeptide repeat protein [Candidatus Melainabacteria bacterium]